MEVEGVECLLFYLEVNKKMKPKNSWMQQILSDIYRPEKPVNPPEFWLICYPTS
jgi:hypothetical protein